MLYSTFTMTRLVWPSAVCIVFRYVHVHQTCWFAVGWCRKFVPPALKVDLFSITGINASILAYEVILPHTKKYKSLLASKANKSSDFSAAIMYHFPHFENHLLWSLKATVAFSIDYSKLEGFYCYVGFRYDSKVNFLNNKPLQRYIHVLKAVDHIGNYSK